MRFLFSGMLLLVAGFVFGVVFVNIPYQDPTPDIQRRWEFNNMIVSWVMMIGLALSLVGIMGIVRRRIRSIPKASQQD